MVRQAVRLVGKTLISAGVLLLLFVAYQLWGTALAQSREQRTLRAQFDRQISAPRADTGAAAPTAPVERPLGDAVALLHIPRIGVEQAIVEGVGPEDLKKGPGHYPETPLPGEPGNAAIAGHRTTYGAPFFHLDQLSLGDPLFVTTRAGRFRYEVTESRVVSPSAIEVLDPTDDARLTLTTCNPRYSAAQRLVVIARLAGAAVEPPVPVPAPSPPPETGPRTELEGRAGLSGATAARTPAVVSGLLAALVWAVTWLVARSWSRRWLAYLLGLPVFLVVLFVFFENVARLLPSNV